LTNDAVAADDDYDPESAARLRGLLTSAIAGLLRASFNHSDAARLQWQTATQKYRERWAQGDLDGILPVLSELVGWLRETGIDPASNAELVALFNDSDFRRLCGRIPSLDANPNLLDVFRRLAPTR
jgi:hypothetical protein